MYARRLPIALLLLVAAASLEGCGGVSSQNFNNPVNDPTLTVTPQIATLAVGASQTFTATTTGTPSQISWVTVDGSYADTGSLTTPGVTGPASGPTATYTAPSTPPVYSNGILTAGTVDVRTISGLTSIDTTFTITAPSITVGFLTPSATTVKLGSTQVLNAYAVGSVNNGLNLQVDGVTGGSTANGTIAAIGGIYGQYQYTAPTAMPMTGNTVTVTAVSTADTTKSASLTLTLQ